jgi:hypothetical protein
MYTSPSRPGNTIANELSFSIYESRDLLYASIQASNVVSILRKSKLNTGSFV